MCLPLLGYYVAPHLPNTEIQKQPTSLKSIVLLLIVTSCMLITLNLHNLGRSFGVGITVNFSSPVRFSVSRGEDESEAAKASMSGSEWSQTDSDNINNNIPSDFGDKPLLSDDDLTDSDDDVSFEGDDDFAYGNVNNNTNVPYMADNNANPTNTNDGDGDYKIFDDDLSDLDDDLSVSSDLNQDVPVINDPDYDEDNDDIEQVIGNANVPSFEGGVNHGNRRNLRGEKRR